MFTGEFVVFRIFACLVVSLLLTTSAITALAQDDAKRSITQVAGDVYRFQNNFHFGVVVITDGIVNLTIVQCRNRTGPNFRHT